MDRRIPLPLALAIIGAASVLCILVVKLRMPGPQAERKTTLNGDIGPLADSRTLPSQAEKPRQSALAMDQKRQEYEKTRWHAIRYSDSINKFENFLSIYPTGEFAAQAKEAIAAAKARQSALAKIQKQKENEKTLWNAIKYSNSINEFENFLRIYPAGEFAARAKQTIAAAKAVKVKAQEDIAALSATVERLKPLHQTLGKPRPGDWLDEHQEPGQTFQQYLEISPVTPTGRRTVIYVQPLGYLTKDQRRLVMLSAEYLGIYMNRPVKILGGLPLSLIPADARRTHPVWKVKQILTTYVLDDVLKPRLPGDAAAYIAFTASDLWPGRGRDIVEGQASLSDRVAVLSIKRNGDASSRDEAFQLCLLRTLKTATHEVGHMFSMLHCIAYECNMCGSSNRAESDRHPPYLCPECHAKLCWATGADPVKRYRRLVRFCLVHGLETELIYYRKAAAALSP